MTIKTKFEADLTVRSFAYVAEHLAKSPAGLAPSTYYERILNEAERHRSALRLVQRNVYEMTEQCLRQQTLTKGECQRVRETAARTIARAQETISRIVAQYAPQMLAA